MFLSKKSMLIAIVLVFFLQHIKTNGNSYDIIIYGGTASGVVASVAAARDGNHVLLIEPGRHVGGMITGGLSHTDYGDRTVIGGMALDFYEEVAQHYKAPLYYWRGPEPHVGERIFNQWLNDSGVDVLYENRLTKVIKVDQNITEIRLSNGKNYSANVFIDASYEGDLMAMAGVSYTVGREGKSHYNEKWAGRQPILPDNHQISVILNPYLSQTEDELVPLIHRKQMVGIGETDKGVQSYCFRLCISWEEDNMLPFKKLKPENYDPANYILISRYYQQEPNAKSMITTWSTLPNNKGDMNSLGPISTNLLDGSNWDYPEADYKERDRIWKHHEDYTKGLLYFMSTDSSVPQQVRTYVNQMGLCKDEFTDNKNFPHQLYVRVARRMKGEYFMTENDLMVDTIKYDAIGMGSYNIDVRHVQRNTIKMSRFPELVDEVYNEGYISIPVSPYEIPYRSIIPKYEECKNLLVPVCTSASFVANASIRMEPQYMIMGHAAGVAASMANKTGSSVHKIDIQELQNKLADQDQILTLKENPYGAINSNKNDIVIDNNSRQFVEKSGSWKVEETMHNGRFQMNYEFSDIKESTFTYKPYFFETGWYKLYLWHPKSKEYTNEASVVIQNKENTERKQVDMTRNAEQWKSLGIHYFDKGWGSKITLKVINEGNTVVSDAIRLKYIGKTR